MEALRTQNDNLRWELNRLDVENRRLQSENPDLGTRLDLETELKQAKNDVAALTEQVEAYKLQIEESENGDGTPAGELERTREELRVATFQTKELREIVTELQAELDEGRGRETELLELQQCMDKEREAELLEVQERTKKEREQ